MIFLEENLLDVVFFILLRKFIKVPNKIKHAFGERKDVVDKMIESSLLSENRGRSTESSCEFFLCLWDDLVRVTGSKNYDPLIKSLPPELFVYYNLLKKSRNIVIRIEFIEKNHDFGSIFLVELLLCELDLCDDVIRGHTSVDVVDDYLSLHEGRQESDKTCLAYPSLTHEYRRETRLDTQVDQPKFEIVLRGN
jgi:hypothetical protein